MYDWKKELRKAKTFFWGFTGFYLIVVSLISIILGVYTNTYIDGNVKGVSAGLKIFVFTFFTVIFYVVFFISEILGSIRQSDINIEDYKRLKDITDKLEKKGHSEVKKEVQRLLEEQGKVKEYQYEKLIEDCKDIKESLELQEAKQSFTA